jgi:anti-sigma regulatory factor (Ser/Thr protein kinase)
MGNQVYVSIAVDGEQLQVSVESAGREFIVQETGEPFRDQEAVKASGRGWGLKLIRRFVDEVRFEKTARGTRIVLIKKIERSAGIQKEDIVNRE